MKITRLGIIGKRLPPEILLVARKVRRKILYLYGRTDWCCGLASKEIVQELRRRGYRDVHLHSGRFGSFRTIGHAYVTVGRYILDVTADQFNDLLEGIKMMAVVWGTRKQLQNLYKNR